MKDKTDLFSSRYAFLFAAIGMAIGAGNIWRFPRLAGQYGGSFLIPWLLFLFIWSIPLIIVEFSLGKNFKLGVIGVFRKGLGKGFTWMGWFIAAVTIGIMFYYSVVCGWSLKYFLMSITGEINTINHERFWQAYTTANYEPILFHILAVLSGCCIIYFGVRSGIENVTRVLIPSLFILITIAAIRAVTLPGANQGLAYFFQIKSQDLFNYRVWLEALSQSAWSTGAGWGLVLTYANYVKKEEKTVSNAFLTGVGNNVASLLCGLAIIPAVFALSNSLEEANTALQAGNQGLTFIYLPQLFSKMPGSWIMTPLFFLSLFIAAISSLIAMLELSVRILMDYGYKRRIAVIIVGTSTILIGLPSAYSLGFFNNQDWVWGIGLLLSGFFFIVFVLRTGINNFIQKFLDFETTYFEKRMWILKFLSLTMLVEFILMFTWWFLQSVNWYPDTWWNPFAQFTIGTCLFQWIIVILIGVIFNERLSRINVLLTSEKSGS
jgi:NSS family neurotransmitter:Na+ symporter